jgi:hypothetical protein
MKPITKTGRIRRKNGGKRNRSIARRRWKDILFNESIREQVSQAEEEED